MRARGNRNQRQHPGTAGDPNRKEAKSDLARPRILTIPQQAHLREGLWGLDLCIASTGVAA